MKKRKVLIVSENHFHGYILAKGLESSYSPLFVNNNEFLKGFMNGALRRQIGNQDTVVLVGYKEEDISNILWQYIRKKPKALHPVLVCGYESCEFFHSRHIEFTERVGRYHRYRQMPWAMADIKEDLGKDKLYPLYDEDHRKDLYAMYGHRDLRKRLPKLLHNLKGTNLEIELKRAKYIRQLIEELHDEKITQLVDTVIDELKSGRLDTIQDLRRTIEVNL